MLTAVPFAGASETIDADVESVEFFDVDDSLVRLEVCSATNYTDATDYEATEVKCYLDDEFAYTIVVDSSNNTLSHVYSDGVVETWPLDELVTITESNSDQNAGINQQVDDVLSAVPYATDTDYVSSETFYVNLSTGKQGTLSGASTYSGYQALGYRGGYSYAPSTYGYLQRKNNGYTLESSDEYAFNSGVTLQDAAAVIYDAIKSEFIFAEMLEGIVDILQTIVSNYYNQYVVTFSIRCYEWLYRVRLNSNTGSIIYTTYRTKSYMVGEDEAGDMALEYMTNKYDDGFLLTNVEMIQTAINSYLGD